MEWSVVGFKRLNTVPLYTWFGWQLPKFKYDIAASMSFLDICL